MKRGWMLILYIIIGAVGFVWLVKVPVLSYCLTKELRVPILIDWVSIWPSESIIHGFKIENPKDLLSLPALEVKETTLHYQLKTFFADPVEIDEIVLDTVVLRIDLPKEGESQNNWEVIGNDMKERTSVRSFKIHTLIVNNLNIVIQDSKVSGRTSNSHIDHLEFHDINSDQGFPTEQMLHQIFGGAGLENYIQDVFNPIQLIEDIVGAAL